MNISLIIFCHNEEDSIADVIQSCLNMLRSFSGFYEIIIVDDGSTDKSSQLIDKIVKENSHMRYIKHKRNVGIGMALRSGYDDAKKEFVCAIPGDGQFNVSELLEVKPFGFDTFYSFYRPQTNYTPYRKFLNFSNRIFNCIFLRIQLKDVNWIKVYRKDQLEFANIKLKSSIVESEICAKLIKSGCKPIELPSVYYKRKSGDSKGGNWKTLSLVIREMFSLYLVVRGFRKQV